MYYTVGVICTRVSYDKPFLIPRNAHTVCLMSNTIDENIELPPALKTLGLYCPLQHTLFSLVVPPGVTKMYIGGMTSLDIEGFGFPPALEILKTDLLANFDVFVGHIEHVNYTSTLRCLRRLVTHALVRVEELRSFDVPVALEAATTRIVPKRCLLVLLGSLPARPRPAVARLPVDLLRELGVMLI